MSAEKKNPEEKKNPTVAPGIDDNDLGEDATEEDKRKGNVTRVVRVFFDDNSPFHRGFNGESPK